MAEMYEIIEELLRDRGISGVKMSTDLGMSRSFMTELRKGRAKSITTQTAQKIADYFGVTADYLLTGEKKENALPSLNQKDERDIEKRLQAMLGELEGEEAGSLMYSGEPLDEETRELLRISIKNQLELSKQLAKKKFTPKKYRKEGD